MMAKPVELRLKPPKLGPAARSLEILFVFQGVLILVLLLRHHPFTFRPHATSHHVLRSHLPLPSFALLSPLHPQQPLLLCTSILLPQAKTLPHRIVHINPRIIDLRLAVAGW